MIGGPIGQPIGPPIPEALAFQQEVNATASGSVVLTRDAGKVVSVPITGLVALGNFAIDKGVAVSGTCTVTATKAMSFTLARIRATARLIKRAAE